MIPTQTLTQVEELPSTILETSLPILARGLALLAMLLGVSLIGSILRRTVFFLKAAFIPDDGFFEDRFDTTKDGLASWLGYQNAIDLMESLQGVSEGGGDFSSSISVYGVGTFDAEIIDTSYFDNNSLWIKNLIRAALTFGVVVYNINQLFAFLNRGSTLANGADWRDAEAEGKKWMGPHKHVTRKGSK